MGKISIYTHLPRYVDELLQENNYVQGKYLPSIIQNIELNNEKFIFVISPARIYNRSSEERHFYQTEKEKFLEEVFKRLAIKNEKTLFCSLSDILNELNIINAPYNIKNSSSIRQSIRVLANVNFELINAESGDELYFRTIERFECCEKDEETYYCIQLSQIFFN